MDAWLLQPRRRKGATDRGGPEMQTPVEPERKMVDLRAIPRRRARRVAVVFRGIGDAAGTADAVGTSGDFCPCLGRCAEGFTGQQAPVADTRRTIGLASRYRR